MNKNNENPFRKNQVSLLFGSSLTTMTVGGGGFSRETALAIAARAEGVPALEK